MKYNRTHFACLLSLAGFALAGCGGGDNTPPAPAGVDGTATQTFLSGVAPPPDAPPGFGKTVSPWTDAIIIVQPSGGGAEVARTTTDPQGKFHLVLPPGNYQVSLGNPPPPSFPGSCSGPQPATVTTGQFATVALDCTTYGV